MGEQRTPGPGDISTSEAADKAKGLLGEAERHGDRPDGQIVDKDGFNLRADAETFVHQHNAREDEYKEQGAIARSFEESREGLLDAADLLNTPDNQHKAAIDELLRHASSKQLTAAEHRGLKDKAKVEQRAVLWDASQHLKTNEAEYRAAAIEDANAAGHDITYEGVDYPAPESTQADDDVTPSTDSAPQG